MFDGQHNNDWDIQMKSILESGQEEVPAHIWDGISSELDAIARRRRTIVFLRRAAVGLSAAAILTFGIFLNHDSAEIGTDSIAEIVEPVYEDEISVTETEVEARQQKAELIAMAHLPEKEGMPEEVEMPEETGRQEEDASGTETVTKDYKKSSSAAKAPQPTIMETGTWKEDDKEFKERKKRTSLVLSGVAGTNSSQNSARNAAIRRPTWSAVPVKTSVTQTEAGDSYGIPLSFGIGTKIDLGSRWSVGAGVNYTLLSRKFFGDYTKVEGEKIESIKSDIRNTQHYIGIPLNAYYNIVENKFVNFYAYAGGAVEKCVSDEYRIISKDILHKEKVSGIQTSANIGIGVEFLLGSHLGIYVDPSARYYFNCNQPKSIRTAQPLMLGFEMGLRVRL